MNKVEIVTAGVKMKVQILKEAGYEQALLGMSLSYKDRSIPLETWWTPEQQAKAASRAAKLAHKNGGHNKFLRQIELWLYVEAPRYWWSEMDTYEFTVAQSESTMHTLAKRPPASDDFEPGTADTTINNFFMVWHMEKNHIDHLKANLPEGFLQARIVKLNYAVLRQILWMREPHRLQAWKDWCRAIRNQVQHPEFLEHIGE